MTTPPASSTAPPMTDSSMTLASSISRAKRFFSEAHKRAVVEKCLASGASVSAVALAHGFNTNLVRKWIVKHQASWALARPAAALIPVSVIDAPGKSTKKPRRGAGKRAPEFPSGWIEIEVGAARVVVRGKVEAEQLRVVLDAPDIKLTGVREQPLTGNRASVAIRPEEITIATGPAAENIVSGRVDNVEYGGRDSLVDIVTPGVRGCTCAHPTMSRWAPIFTCTFRPSACSSIRTMAAKAESTDAVRRPGLECSA